MAFAVRLKSDGRILQSYDHAKKETIQADVLRMSLDDGATFLSLSDVDILQRTPDQIIELWNNDPTRVEDKEIENEEQLIEEEKRKVQDDRDRKIAVERLKQKGETFKHFDDNGKRKPKP